MSPEFESRRQRRELEAQQAAALASSQLAPQVTPQYQVPAMPLYAPAPVAVAPVPTQAPTPAPAPAQAPTLSRRELRQQEQAASAAANPAPAAAYLSQPAQTPSSSQPAPFTYSSTSWIQDVTPPVSPAPAAMPMQAAQAPAPVVLTAAPAPTSAQVPSRRELRDQLRQPVEAAAIPVTPFAQPWSELAVTPMFETSSGFSLDTTTNSIVLPITPDALAGPLVIESGVTLRTGSIELPNLNAGTGSIPLPTAAQIADDALSMDSANSFVSNIAPVAARNLLRKNPKLAIAPLKTKGTQGQLFYGLTTAILMLTVGALLVWAWMVGLLK